MTPKIEAFYASPAKQGTKGRTFYLEDTSLRFTEALTLNQLARESGATNAMEIGTALGASGVAIAEALEQSGRGRLVTLDPFQNAFGHVGVSELARLGLDSWSEFVPALAEEYLCEARKQGRLFDFILIDGAHSVGIKMTHTFFADLCLAPSGTMVFHDGFMPSTAACVKYLVREQGYVPVPLRPDSSFKRMLRICKYARVHGPWYAWQVVRHSHCSLVALRKPARSEVASSAAA